MSVTTDASELIDKTRKTVDDLTAKWARMVSEEMHGASEYRRDFTRDTFNKLLALKDALK